VDEEKAEAIQLLHDQIADLRTGYLPALGYRNIFIQKGYEADDIIASLCSSITDGEIVIVSTDTDLWQLLQWRRVTILRPDGTFYAERAFTEEWNLEPCQWAWVKAIAGCKSDGVVGVVGVGEKTAAKYLNNLLPKKSKAYIAIRKAWRAGLIDFNRGLVFLPLSGIKILELASDVLSSSKWDRVMRTLDMRSLLLRKQL
jgi:5'-3' exonuclease